MKIHTCYLMSGGTITFRDVLWSEWVDMYEKPETIQKCIIDGEIKTPEDLEEFTNMVIATIGVKKSSKKTEKGASPDHDVTEGFMMHHFNQQWQSIRDMPVRKIYSLIELLPVVLGQEKWDPMKNSPEPDKKALRGLKGHGGVKS